MTDESTRIIFVIGNSIQQEAALQVAKELTSVSVEYLNLWTMKLHESAVTFSGHSPKVSLKRIVKAMRLNALTQNDITVLPQDVGLLQRLIALQAKKAGGLLALMPDGVVASGANSNGTALKLFVRNLVDTSLRMLGLVEGKAGSMGSSGPHLILSWGAGWDHAFSAGSSTDFIHLGCPRMDKYAAIGQSSDSTNLLICSQPLGIPNWSKPYASEWYALLESLMEEGVPGYTVRIRLHPAETDHMSVPARLREANFPRPLLEDLQWASAVASPFSTVLVEAMAANRRLFVLSADAEFDIQAQRTPLFADQRVQVARWNVTAIAKTLMSLDESRDLKKDYLSETGNSARAIAEALKLQATGRKIDR